MVDIFAIQRQQAETYAKCISCGDMSCFGLKVDGSVVGNGNYGNTPQQPNMFHEGRNIVAISAQGFNLIGLRADGTIICLPSYWFSKTGKGSKDLLAITQKWSNIVSIASSNFHTVGLKDDGTVVATGNNSIYIKRNKQSEKVYSGQCETLSWSGIKAIACGLYHTVGIKADGRVVAVGFNEIDNDEKCLSEIMDLHCGRCDTQTWTDIVSVVCGVDATVGLRKDGTVVVAGLNIPGYKSSSGAVTQQYDTRDWRDIVAIACGQPRSGIGDNHIVGLKADGTVVAVGQNAYGACNTQHWRDVVAIACTHWHTVGLRKDGTVVATGHNVYGQCNTINWQNIIAIFCDSWYTGAIQADGSVVVTGNDEFGPHHKWTNIGPITETRKLQMKGVCQHCGGKFTGFFSKTCINCGKPKDY